MLEQQVLILQLPNNLFEADLEMEVNDLVKWKFGLLQAYGAAYILQELLTIKSDDVEGRKEAVFRIYTNQPIRFGPPESFRVLLRELQALCFSLKIYGHDSKTGRVKSLSLTSLEKLGW